MIFDLHSLTPHLVGRETELAHLQQWLEQAARGERQIVFLTGEPGIGKTTMVEAFLQSLESKTLSASYRDIQTLDRRHQTLNASLWIARGQCVEHYGTGEPYLPVLEALGRLGRGPHGKPLTAVLRQHAPTWLAQLPALLSTIELKALQPRIVGATRERMLREVAEALEVLTAVGARHAVPLLVLWLEDLHWADTSTLDFLAMLARRREPARLLVLGTYRPVEVLGKDHPLNGVRQELLAHNLCTELPLPGLSEADVSAYLTLRFPQSVLPARLAPALHQRTGGNPLFLTGLVQDLIKRDVLVQVDGCWALQGGVATIAEGVPESIRQLVARQRERLPRLEQQVLAAASVAGQEFSAAAVAAALNRNT